MRGDATDYSVYDGRGARIGTVERVWVDPATDEPEFFGIKTGWILGRTHVVPVEDARVDHTERSLRLPFDKERVSDAPTVSPMATIGPEEKERIHAHYRGLGGAASGGLGGPEGTLGASGADRARGAREGEARMQLSEEELSVGKRTVDSGGAHLRKVVRTEHVERPIDLSHEEVHIERTAATGSEPVPENAFQEERIDIETTREEPVVGKTAHVTGEVRAYKTSETERRMVSGDVRKEDVEIDEGPGRTGREK